MPHFHMGSYRINSCTHYYWLGEPLLSDPDDEAAIKSYDHILYQALSSVLLNRNLTTDQIETLLCNPDPAIKQVLDQEPILSRHFSKEKLEKISLLWIAVLGCYQDSAELLVRSGADVNELFGCHSPQIIDKKCCILHLLVQMNLSAKNERLIRLVRDQGADVQTQDSRGRTVLYLAATVGKRNRVKLTEMILEKSVDVNIATYLGNTPLLAAAASNEADELLPLLIKYGADLTATDKDGQNALHCLSRSTVEQAADLARELIRRGVPVNERASSLLSYFQPIHTAVAYRNNELVNVFLDHGADVNALTGDGDSPLILATLCNNKPPLVVRTLLKRGAKIDLTNISGRTALHFACEKFEEESIKLLLSAGANMLIEDDKGKTPLALVYRENMKNPCITLMIKKIALRTVCMEPTIKLKDERIIHEHPKLWDYYRDCHALVLRLKCTRLVKNCTFFELVTKNSCQIAELMRNPAFEANFKMYDLSGFSTYSEDVIQAFERAQNYYQSLLKQEEVINEAVYNILPYVVVRKVVGFIFLCCKNLKTF